MNTEADELEMKTCIIEPSICGKLDNEEINGVNENYLDYLIWTGRKIKGKTYKYCSREIKKTRNEQRILTIIEVHIRYDKDIFCFVQDFNVKGIV